MKNQIEIDKLVTQVDEIRRNELLSEESRVNKISEIDKMLETLRNPPRDSSILKIEVLVSQIDTIRADLRMDSGKKEKLIARIEGEINTLGRPDPKGKMHYASAKSNTT